SRRSTAGICTDRHDFRTLLRDGSRPSLGSRRQGLCRNRGSGRAALRYRSSRDCRVRCAQRLRRVRGAVHHWRLPRHEGLDGVLCFNFRADRVREILTALLDPDFSAFPRRRAIDIAAAAGMTESGQQLNALMQAIFPSRALPNVLGQLVSAAGRTQLRMAETEKDPHVTYFLNGGREDQYTGEDRIKVPSPKVATYDLQPEMSAPELTD